MKWLLLHEDEEGALLSQQMEDDRPGRLHHQPTQGLMIPW